MSSSEKFWAWVAFAVLAFVFVLHAQFSRSEKVSVPNIGTAGYNFDVGHASHA